MDAARKMDRDLHHIIINILVRPDDVVAKNADIEEAKLSASSASSYRNALRSAGIGRVADLVLLNPDDIDQMSGLKRLERERLKALVHWFLNHNAPGTWKLLTQIEFDDWCYRHGLETKLTSPSSRRRARRRTRSMKKSLLEDDNERFENDDCFNKCVDNILLKHSILAIMAFITLVSVGTALIAEFVPSPHNYYAPLIWVAILVLLCYFTRKSKTREADMCHTDSSSDSSGDEESHSDPSVH